LNHFAIVAPAKEQSNDPIICLDFSPVEAWMRSPTQEIAMRRHKDNRTALDAFLAHKAEIDTMLDRLKARSDDHFGYSPDDIDWGHVGTVAHYAELLRKITDAAFKEGEYAA
jgi:hypothetical protein